MFRVISNGDRMTCSLKHPKVKWLHTGIEESSIRSYISSHLQRIVTFIHLLDNLILTTWTCFRLAWFSEGYNHFRHGRMNINILFSPHCTILKCLSLTKINTDILSMPKKQSSHVSIPIWFIQIYYVLLVTMHCTKTKETFISFFQFCKYPLFVCIQLNYTVNFHFEVIFTFIKLILYC